MVSLSHPAAWWHKGVNDGVTTLTCLGKGQSPTLPRQSGHWPLQ